MDLEALKGAVVSNVRSCLISTKGQITLKQLESDYLTLLGERIPYRKLGHQSLEAFVESVPSLVVSRSKGGEVLVDARVSEKTEHISSMVQRQKNAAPKKKVRMTYPHHHSHHHRKMMQPPPNTPRWKPKKNPYHGGGGGIGGTGTTTTTTSPNGRAYGKAMPRSAAAATQKQFVSGGGYTPPKVASRVVVPEGSEFKKVSPPKEPVRRHSSSPEKLQNDSNESIIEEESCSPLTSTMKRITKIMSGMSVDRDSGNSSPTTEFASNSNYKNDRGEFIKTGDPVLDLRNFVAYHKLGEVDVKFTYTKTKKAKISQCHCKITVGQHIYSSYPKDFHEEKAAEEHASTKALHDLMARYSRKKSLLLSSNVDIIERIPPMLEKYNNAVWMWQVENDYVDKYEEQLPADWLQIIDNSPHVSIENCLGGCVLKHCNPNDVLQKGKKLDVSLKIGEVSVPCNTVSCAPNNRLYAVITAAHSTNEIWCQQCGTAEYESFVRMNTEMEAYYSAHKAELLAPAIHIGSCYVVNHDNGWIRARTLEMPQEGVFDCFLIDYGEEVHVSAENIYVMKREFAVEQAQAFVCRLDGLEDFYEASLDSQHMAALVGKEYVLEVVLDETGDNDDDVAVLVVMYDIDTGSPFNEELISLLTIESSLPALDKNVITEVYVSNIESNGDVYVQVRSVGYFRLVEMLRSLIDTIATDPPRNFPTPNRQNSQNKLYLVRCKVAKTWLRATIIDWAPRGDLAQIYFVDVGNAQVVNVATEMMYPLELLNDAICQYPAQAVKVRFMIEQIPSDFVERATRLLPRDRPVLLKISSYDNEEVPWVEFFKRTNDGVLVFINKSISVEAELSNFDVGTAVNNNDLNKKRLINLVQFGDTAKPVPSGGALKKPNLPKIGDYFNVNVPFAVNPWNFFVQPLDSLNDLTLLMADMQNYYKELQFSPVQIEDIIPGKIYASKHTDGLWYRTSVLKVIHSGSISAFYCDFGHYANLTLAQLVPIDPKYMTLPYQAIKAKISGIQPMKNKWTVEDCDAFNSLVIKKQFVSVLVNIEKDDFYKSDIVLQLLLIDTSSEKDVNIKEVLIERGIALSA